MAIAWQSTRRQMLFFREEEDWYYCSTVHDWVDDWPAGSAHASSFGAMCLASPSCSGCSLVASRAGLWVSSIGVQTSCYFCFRRRKGGRGRDPRLLSLMHSTFLRNIKTLVQGKMKVVKTEYCTLVILFFE
jgi:hypothetical protein